MSREELKSRLKVEARLLGPLLEALSSRGEIVDGYAWIAWRGHAPTLHAADQSRLEVWAARMRAAPYSPPSWKEGFQELGEELAAYYLESGQGIQVSADVVFEASAYQAIVKIVLEGIAAKGGITVADLRDRLGASRKYALAFLEHLDRTGITRREGDIRRLGASAPPSA
jgi:selenocysteine-specific elongation factor